MSNPHNHPIKYVLRTSTVAAVESDSLANVKFNTANDAHRTEDAICRQ